jgi:hypothetical protein
MRKMKNAAHSGNDELYTPAILAESILPFVKRFKVAEKLEKPVVWCPFDTEKSEIVKALKSIGCDVFSSIIKEENGDFFEKLPPAGCDMIISNPPFSAKKAVFQRLNELRVPYAMLMNYMALGYQEIGEMFVENPVQLIIPDKKVSFDGRTSSFNTLWVCRFFLQDRDLEFVHLENNNSRKFFKPSEMLCDACQLCDGEAAGVDCVERRDKKCQD